MNHQAKFKIDWPILTCLNLRKELTEPTLIIESFTSINIFYSFYLSGVANNVMNAARRLPQVPEATTNGGFFSKLFGKKDQQHHPQVCFTQLIVLDFLYKSNSFFNRQISGLEPVLSLLKNHV